MATTAILRSATQGHGPASRSHQPSPSSWASQRSAPVAVRIRDCRDIVTQLQAARYAPKQALLHHFPSCCTHSPHLPSQRAQRHCARYISSTTQLSVRGERGGHPAAWEQISDLPTGGTDCQPSRVALESRPPPQTHTMHAPVERRTMTYSPSGETNHRKRAI